jgi:hypothetical protein
MVMLRSVLIISILLLLALGVADARVPMVGDHVGIIGTGSIKYIEGTITDIENGFLCINTGASRTDGENIDYCFGIGAIAELRWI